MKRYTLFADAIEYEDILESSDNLDDVVNTARLYDYEDSPYGSMYILDNNFDEVVWDNNK